MRASPKGVRLHIGIFGRMNAGKSSLLNLLAGQDVSIASPVPGTTTDAVEKAMELLPLGPVLLLDTAGLDDRSELAAARAVRTRRVLDRVDVALLVTEPDRWGEPEETVDQACRAKGIPLVLVVNKTDLRPPSAEFLDESSRRARWIVKSSCARPEEREAVLRELKSALVEACPEDFLKPPPLLADLLPASALAVFVVPIDIQAPKGRLILPQVQSLRDALDVDASVLVVKERGLARALGSLTRPPDIVVCDSQAVLKAAADVPPGVRLTTFSILFARAKADLVQAARGAARLETLRPGDRVLIAEGCSHHALEDDIGRVKLPRWLRQYVGGDIDVEVASGEFPEDLSRVRAVIHCGGCVLNRRAMLSRVARALQAGVPVTNYGIAIAALQGLASRVLEPFPDAQRAYESELKACRRPGNAGGMP